MKKIGLLGGMSWESTAVYYQCINESMNKRLKGLHSAEIILYSVDFAEIEACQSSGDWQKSAALLLEAAKALERAGADFLVLCTNTMHKVIPMIEGGLSIPFLHIADVCGKALVSQAMQRVALLGTTYTMSQTFYSERLKAKGIDVLVPDQSGKERVNRIIYDELCLGSIRDHSREIVKAVIADLIAEGAQGVVLGCTELGLLLSAGDVPVPLFDTTFLHAEAAVDFALLGAKVLKP